MENLQHQKAELSKLDSFNSDRIKKAWSKPTVEIINTGDIQSGVDPIGSEAGSGPVYVS
ncbi:hypothetical protein PBAL39_09181 [Pedobacter sp. BAL39]|nr:hypothetical protein PBAL39_09181 [Pedobacter sp. BAL39]